MNDHQLAATKISRMLADRYEIVVLFQGREMRCSKDKVVLPAWDLSSKDTRDLVMGINIHECGHAVSVDFDFHMRWLQAKPPALMDKYREASNIVSDIREEHNQMGFFRGARYFLNKTVEHLDVPADPEKLAATDDAWRIAFSLALYGWRVSILSFTQLRPQFAAVRNRALELLGSELVGRIEAMGHKIVSIGRDRSNYPQVTRLADEFVQMLLDAQQQQQQQQSSNNQNGASDQADGSGDPSSGDQSDPNDQSGQQSGGSGGNESGDKGSKDPSAGSSPGQENATDDQSASGSSTGGSDTTQGASGSQSSSNGSDPASPDANAPGASSGGSEPQDPASGTTGGKGPDPKPSPNADWTSTLADGEFDVTKGASSDIPMAPEPYEASAGINAGSGLAGHSPISLMSIRQKTTSLAAKLIGPLNTMLNDEDHLEERGLRSGSRLQRGRMVPAYIAGAPFRRKLHVEALTAEVLVNADLSDSTSRIQHEVAAASLSLSDALRRFENVSSAVYGFPGSAVSPIVEILRPGQNITSALAKWPSASGGTPLFRALLALVPVLMVSDKQRRIILTVTDGVPTADARKAALAAVKRAGIEHYGVVIGSAKYDLTIFDASVQIDDVTQLPAALRKLALAFMRPSNAA